MASQGYVQEMGHVRDSSPRNKAFQIGSKGARGVVGKTTMRFCAQEGGRGFGEFVGGMAQRCC